MACKPLYSAAFSLILVFASNARSQTITDGDTIRLNGTTYRLWGIDAPEKGQWCGTYPAGITAEGTLEMLMRGKSISCEPRTTDRYGRTVALCTADGEDLGKAMVQSGMAWAFVRYSHDYAAVEAQAKQENIGIHAHGCQPAWEWRAAARERK